MHHRKSSSRGEIILHCICWPPPCGRESRSFEKLRCTIFTRTCLKQLLFLAQNIQETICFLWLRADMVFGGPKRLTFKKCHSAEHLFCFAKKRIWSDFEIKQLAKAIIPFILVFTLCHIKSKLLKILTCFCLIEQHKVEHSYEVEGYTIFKIHYMNTSFQALLKILK